MARRRQTSTLRPRERLELERKLAQEYVRETFGLGVQCTRCAKWRVASEWSDERAVPHNFDCSMIIIDGTSGNCDIPSNLEENSDQFASDKYLPGQIVWAKLIGNPWWPALVKDDPEMDHYVREEANGRKKFFVGFFDVKLTKTSSSRRSSWSWVEEQHLRHFEGQSPNNPEKHQKQASSRLVASIQDAREALKVAETHRILWWVENYLIGPTKKKSKKSEDKNGTDDSEMETETVENGITLIHDEHCTKDNETMETLRNGNSPIQDILEESSHSSYFFERPEEFVPVSSARERLRSDMELEITVLKNVELIENKVLDDSTRFIQEESKVNFEDSRIYSFQTKTSA